MTHRERFSAVLEGLLPDRLPMVTRMDVWYEGRKRQGVLPPEVGGLSLFEIEDKLHMGRSARFRGFHSERRQGVTERVVRQGERTIRTLETDGRSVSQVAVSTGQLKERGIEGLVLEHCLKTADDYRTMIRIWERTQLVADHSACERFDRETGDAGLPVLVFTITPIHRIMLEYAGYQNFYFHQADFPDLVDELRVVMELVYESFWEELAACGMDLILHGAHWSSGMTPPPLFEEKFLPYIRRFTNAMHAAGKRCAFHADADLSRLLELVLDTGMDVADCFACQPLVPLTLHETRRTWGDRIVVWGGFPSTLLEPFATSQEFHEYLDSFLREVSDGRSIVVGVSDNVMPDATWARITALAERVSLVRPTLLTTEWTGE